MFSEPQKYVVSHSNCEWLALMYKLLGHIEAFPFYSLALLWLLVVSFVSEKAKLSNLIPSRIDNLYVIYLFFPKPDTNSNPSITSHSN